MTHNSDTFLFVGGLLDGDRREVPSENRHKVAVVRRPAPVSTNLLLKDGEEPVGEVNFEEQEYRPFHLGVGLSKAEVYAPGDWSTRQVLQTLLEGYRSPG